MKKALSLLLAMGMMFAFVACGNDNASTPAPADDNSVADVPADNNEGGDIDLGVDEVFIGGIAPLTGGVSQYGIAVNNGALMAVEEINANGGIAGVPIKYVCEDDQGDPSGALNAYAKLMNDGIHVLMGAVTSGPSVAVAQDAAEAGIPMISASATQEDFTLKGDNIFRTCFLDPYQGQLMANYAFERLGAGTVAVLYDVSNDYSEGIAQAFSDEAERLGMEVVAYESYPADTFDFSAQLTNIKNADPDAIMAPCYYEEAALIITQARNLGIESDFVGPDGWDGVLEQVDASNMDLLNNSFFCNQYSRESTAPEMQAFLSEYESRYGEKENMFAVLGYETIFILAAAIEEAGSVEYADVVDAMNRISVSGLTGVTSFDSNGNPVRTAFITEFKDGEAVVAEEYDF